MAFVSSSRTCLRPRARILATLLSGTIAGLVFCQPVLAEEAVAPTSPATSQTTPAVAQSAPAAPTAIVSDPCSTLPAPPPEAARKAMVSKMLEPGHPELGAVLANMAQSPEGKAAKDKAWADARYDWPALCRYRADNAALKQKPYAVFMGDSITDAWILGDPDMFEQAKAVDRGISGQTSSQMLARFYNDVIDLHPQVVHIMAGTNDIAGNTGPLTMQDYENNIMAMVDLAHVHGIRVALASIPPSAAFWWAPDIRPVQMILELNAWLKSYATSKGLTYVDYYSALVSPDGTLGSSFSNDGVHPDRDGYAAMRPLALQAIAKGKQKTAGGHHKLKN